MSKASPIIAIDGTAASGKGTLARWLADELGFAYLDTGKLYRYVGWKTLENGGDPENEEDACAAALGPITDLDNPALKSDEAGQAASLVGRHKSVRAALLDMQRNFAARPPGGAPGAVLDGRDIGTVICPQADLKLFVTADLEVRAQRRFKELQFSDNPVTYEAVLADMRARDARDAGCKIAPMKPAGDAIVIDTTDMSIGQVRERALSCAQKFL